MRALLSALAAAALLAPAAHAADPQVVDVRGDANGFNDQAALPAKLSWTSPVSAAAYDLVEVRFATSRVTRRVTGFTVSVTLAEPPAPASTFIVKMSSASCREIWLEHVIAETGDTSSDLRHRCTAVGPADLPTYAPLQVVTGGRTMTFVLPLEVLPRGVELGETLRDLRAESRTFLLTASVPVIDVATSTATYRIGQ
jgi:hypothetical protein